MTVDLSNKLGNQLCSFFAATSTTNRLLSLTSCTRTKLLLDTIHRMSQNPACYTTNISILQFWNSLPWYLPVMIRNVIFICIQTSELSVSLCVGPIRLPRFGFQRFYCFSKSIYDIDISKKKLLKSQIFVCWLSIYIL